ncbi:MAG: hypothetical protein R3E90_04540 [Marinicella sp.]|nr:hypothetical protein [Xanthomonadales bacterium]
MNDKQLNELLAYRQPVADREFVENVMQQIEQRKQRRNLIMWCCALLGLLCSVVYFVSVSSSVWHNLTTPLNVVMLFGLALFMTWLWTVELNNQ